MVMDEAKWAKQQIDALVALGIDIHDAEATISSILKDIQGNIPPNEWMPSIMQIDDKITDADVREARIAWYAASHVPGNFKRLLDA